MWAVPYLNCHNMYTLCTPYPIALHTGSPAPFLYTPTSLLPQHSVLTDVQQATGKNGQQWITCRSGGQGTRPQIWMGSELVACSSTANMVVIGLGTDIQRLRGHYHCLSAQSQRKYFSLYLGNFGKQVQYHISHTKVILVTMSAAESNTDDKLEILQCTLALPWHQ